MSKKTRRYRELDNTIIPERLYPAIACFIDRARKIPNLKFAIIFGSVVTGEFRKKSDVDILLLFDTEHDPEFGVETKIAQDISSYVAIKYDLAHSFSLMIANIADDSTDTDFLWEIAKEGTIIWGDPSEVLISKPRPNLTPELLVTYSTEGLSSKDKAALHRGLYGYRVEKRVGDKVYINEKKGLITEKGRKMGRGVVVIPARFSDQLIEILEAHHARYSIQRIWT